MPIQTATTGNLEVASKIAFAQCRQTMEANQPCVELISHATLKKGEKQLTWPKVGQMTAQSLTDGIPYTASESIGMTSTDLTTGEVGLLVILTDKLLYQENEDVFGIIGVQMGNAMARKKNRDAIALYAGLNGGTSLGGAGKTMSMANLAGAMAQMDNTNAPRPYSVVQHPYAVFALTKSISITPMATYPIPDGFAADKLKDFYKMNINGVPIFQTADIDRDTLEDAVGAIFSKSAMCIVESKAPTTEKARDILLRGYKVTLTSDYGCWEIDDGYGFPLTFDAAAPSTNA